MVACLTALPNISQGAVIKYFSMLRIPNVLKFGSEPTTKRVVVKKLPCTKTFDRLEFFKRLSIFKSKLYLQIWSKWEAEPESQ